MGSNGSGCSICIPPRSTTRRWRRWRTARRSASTSICRCSTRPIAVLEAHEAPRHAPDLRQAADAHPRARARRLLPHHLHRRVPRRDGSTTPSFRRRFVGDHVFDHVGAFTYLARGRGTSAPQLDDDVPAAVEDGGAPRNACHEPPEEAGGRSGSSAGGIGRARHPGQRWMCSSSDHDLVLKGRLATQAPDIDASVFLTECDPSTVSPWRFCSRWRLSEHATSTSSSGAPYAIIYGFGAWVRTGSGRVPTFFV